MELLTSWDDGCKEDIRMADLLKEYKLPGIFFIPSNTGLDESDICYLAKDFEIGGHTVTHPMDMKLLDRTDAFYEIRDNKEWLEDITGKDIDWFCYPRGRYNKETIELVEEAGFKYARTTQVGNIGVSDPYEVHPTLHMYPDRKEYAQEPLFQYALKQYRMSESNNNSYYHIWGHSWEVEKFALWDILEQLFKSIYDSRN